MMLTPLTQSNIGCMGRAIPAGRIGRPEDTAEAVLFLDIAGYEINVDGGVTDMLRGLVPRGECR